MKLTIITVTLNCLEELKKTYISLSTQNCIDFQWLIKDGLSTDNTIEYCEELKRISNFEIDIISSKDTSIYDAMNQSFQYIRGEYCLFLNSGDLLSSDNVISMFVNRNYYNSNLVFGDVIDIHKNQLKIVKQHRHINYIYRSLPTSHQSIFYLTKTLQTVAYPCEYKICGDYAITALIFLKDKNSYCELNYPISIFSLGGYSSSNRIKLLNEAFNIQQKILRTPLILSIYYITLSFISLLLLDKTPMIYKLLRSFSNKYFTRRRS